MTTKTLLIEFDESSYKGHRERLNKNDPKEVKVKKTLTILATLIFAFMFFSALGTLSLTEETMEIASVKVLSIPAPAFELPNELASYNNNGVLSLNVEPQYIRAPLILPNGTRLKKIQLVCKDNNTEGSIRMWLHVLSNDLSESFTLCVVESEGAEDTYRVFSTTDITPNKINNVNYNYFLNLRLPGTQTEGYEFVAAKVWYKGKW